MFGNNNRGTSYWNNSGQTNNNLSGAFNSIGSTSQVGQQGGSLFGGFGSSNTLGSGGFSSSTPTNTFGSSQGTSLFGQSAQQPASNTLGGVGNTGGLFGQSNQGFMGSSTGLFGQNTQSGGLFGSSLNTGIGTTGGFGSSLNTGSSLFGSSNTNTTGSVWPSSTAFSSFGGQIQGNEVAGPKHFDGATITNISYEKPDVCQDEYRWEYYKKQTPQLTAGGMQQPTGTVGGLFGSAQQPATTGSFFGGTQTTTPTTGGLFGSTQPHTSTGLFGSNQPSTGGGLFGSTQPSTGTGLFGSTQTGTTGGLFGSTQPSTTSTGLFGTTQTSTGTGGLFGGTQSGTTGTTGGLFGTTQTTPGATSFFGGTNQQTGTGTGLFGNTQTSTTGTSLFGTPAAGTTTNTGTTGLFGGTTTTTAPTGGLFGTTTSTFGGDNKSLFGSATTPGSTTTTGTGTGTGLFGSSSLFGSTTTPVTTTATTNTTGTTGLFGGPSTLGSTGTGLFGTQPNSNSTNTGSTNMFGGTNTGTSTNLFGSTNTTGTSNLFGSSTLGGTGTSTGLFGQGGSNFNLFGTSNTATQQQQQGNMRLGHLTLNWDINTPSPGISSFWSNTAQLPREAQEYLAKISSSTPNQDPSALGLNKPQENQGVSNATEKGLTPFENHEDRFGLRKVLKELGVTVPRYTLQSVSSYDDMGPEEDIRTTRHNQYLRPEDKVEAEMSESFIKVSKHKPNVKFLDCCKLVDDAHGDPFLTLHNGGINEFDALKFQARGGQLRKSPSKDDSLGEEEPFFQPNRPDGAVLILSKMDQGDLITIGEEVNKEPFSYNNNKFNENYESNLEVLTAMSNSLDRLEEESEDGYAGSPPSVSEGGDSQAGCPVFKLADDGPGKPPILTKEGYSTRPTMSSLKQMTDRQLSNVMDFQIIRDGYGEILWPGYTDVRQLNLDNIVDISHRKVTLYGNTKKIHPVGEGLNKNAIVTLENCFPKDSESDGSITRTVEQMERLKDHTIALGCKFISANLQTGQWSFEAPCFVKNPNSSLMESKRLSFSD